MQSTLDRVLNLGAALMYERLVYLPAWRDMRVFCRVRGLTPPELTLSQSSTAAGIFLTDWVFERPEPLPPRYHARGPAVCASVCVCVCVCDIPSLACMTLWPLEVGWHQGQQHAVLSGSMQGLSTLLYMSLNCSALRC